jgi:SulP family sulfate permease
VLLAPLASSIPLASLAAILFVVAWNMSESRRFVMVLKRAPLADRAILVITFLLTVFADLVVAVNVGVILAVLQFLRRMSETTQTQAVDAQLLQADLRELGLAALPANVVVYEVGGPLFFGAVDNIRRTLLETNPMPEKLIIRLHNVPFMDITGIQALEEVMDKLRKRGMRVLLCEANARVYGKLKLADVLTDGSYCGSLRAALSQVLTKE